MVASWGVCIFRPGFAVVAGIILVLLAASGSSARASTCTFGITELNFGNVDTLAGTAVDSTATLSISCTGMALGSVRVCPNINAGAGGSSGGWRQMRNGTGSTLDFQLYRDASRSTLWGSAAYPVLGLPPTIDLFATPITGTATKTVTIYGRIAPGQEPRATGNYLSTFSGSETQFVYGDISVLNCAVTLIGGIARPTFATLAQIEANCLVEAQDMDFGVHGLLDQPVETLGEIGVICTPGTSFKIGLGGGLSGNPLDRQMRHGANAIRYNLFQDAGHGQLWTGDGAGILAGIGDGSLLAAPVYGRVPAQPSPVPGTYQDTVVVTVTY
ncbi:Csu type fimbrial protein [Thalassospira marina]|nr:spore coat U domain-containing protein [Thalassospira marina]